VSDVAADAKRALYGQEAISTAKSITATHDKTAAETKRAFMTALF
jgi:hypothetical protein